MLRCKVPAHLDANPFLHSICIRPASAARAASFKSLYRKRARTTCVSVIHFGESALPIKHFSIVPHFNFTPGDWGTS